MANHTPDDTGSYKGECNCAEVVVEHCSAPPVSGQTVSQIHAGGGWWFATICRNAPQLR